MGSDSDLFRKFYHSNSQTLTLGNSSNLFFIKLPCILLYDLRIPGLPYQNIYHILCSDFYPTWNKKKKRHLVDRDRVHFVVFVLLGHRVMTHKVFAKCICCLRGNGLEIWRIWEGLLFFHITFHNFEYSNVPIWYTYFFLIKNNISMKRRKCFYQ